MREDKPAVHQISQMTNKYLPSVADNFNLFADAINFNLIFGGRFTTAPFGNHLTELESLIYILDFRIEDPTGNEVYAAKTIKYIKFLLSNSTYFRADDSFIETYHKNLMSDVTLILTSNYSELEGVRRLKSDIEKILEIIKNDFMRNVVSHIYLNVQCKKHKPKFHYKYFKYFAQLLFAYYYNKGYTRNDIRYFMNRVLSKDMHSTEDESKVYTSAFLPKELYKKLIENNSGKLKHSNIFQEVKAYLDTRTLEQQVRGLENIDYREKSPFKFVFRLENLFINESPVFFENIELYGHKYFVEKFNDRIKSTYDFFQEPKLYSCSYAVLGCEEYSLDKAVKVCLAQLESAMAKFRLRHQSLFLINKLQYVVNIDTEDEEFAVNLVYNRYVFYDHERALLNSPKHISKDSKRQNFFNQIDDVLGEAYTAENDHVSISSYWKFCDVVTNYITHTFWHRDGPNEIIEKKVQYIALILALIETRSNKFYIRLWARNVANNTRLDEEELIFSSKKLRKEIMVDTVGFVGLQKFYTSIKHIHTKARLKDAIDINKKGQFKEKYLFYTSIFLKVYALRNAENHFHVRFDNNARNLKLALDEILRELRIELSLEAKKYANRDKSMRQIVQGLVEKGYSSLNAETK